MIGRANSPRQNHHVITLASLAKQVETRGSAVAGSSDFRRPTNLGPGVEALRAKWGWIVARVAGTARDSKRRSWRGHNEKLTVNPRRETAAYAREPQIAKQRRGSEREMAAKM